MRQIVNTPELKLRSVCFLDDDVRKYGAEIHGVPVVGGLESLALAADRYRINKIIIGTEKLSPHARSAIRTLAAPLGLEVADVTLGGLPENGG